MRILGPFVLPSTALMAALDPEIARGDAIGRQVVHDQPIGNEAAFPQKLAHQFQCGTLVSLERDQHIEDFALGVDPAYGSWESASYAHNLKLSDDERRARKIGVLKPQLTKQ
jgi:hypothetical protein